MCVRFPEQQIREDDLGDEKHKLDEYLTWDDRVLELRQHWCENRRRKNTRHYPQTQHSYQESDIYAVNGA